MKKINICGLLLIVLVVGNVSAKKPPQDKYKLPEFYYQEGCKALNKKKLELAKENFKKAVEKNILFTSFPAGWGREVAISMEKDISKVEDFENNGIEWKVYYYKGLLESNLVFALGINNFVVSGCIESKDKELAIKSFEKSIEIFDNYQSHIVLSILKPSEEEVELKKVVELSLKDKNFIQAYETEFFIGYRYEEREDFKAAIEHYENGYEYSKKVNPHGTTNFSMQINTVNKKIEMFAKAKDLGFNSYKEYDAYKNKIQTIVYKENYWNGNVFLSQVGEKKEELEKSIAVFEITEKDFAAEIAAVLGLYYEKKDDFDKALMHYKKAEKLDSDIKLSYELDLVKKSLSEFDKDLSHRPVNSIIEEISIINNKIKILPQIKQNGFATYSDYEEYKKEIKENSFDTVDNRNIEVLIGRLDNYKEEVEQGIVLFSKTEPDFAALLEFSLGVYYEEKEKFDLALEHYKKTLKYGTEVYLYSDIPFISNTPDYRIAEVNEKLKMMPMIREQGFSSYKEYQKFLAESEKKRKELAAKRTSWRNLYYWFTYAKQGKIKIFLRDESEIEILPLNINDIITVPAGEIQLFDMDIVDGCYSYIFSTAGYYKTCAQLISYRQISNIYVSGSHIVNENLKIRVEGKSHYKIGPNIADCYLFSLVE